MPEFLKRRARLEFGDWHSLHFGAFLQTEANSQILMCSNMLSTLAAMLVNFAVGWFSNFFVSFY